jgi:hypothetical protein
MFNKRPILGICGDSFMAATINATDNATINGESRVRIDLEDSAGKHFTELLAKKIDYDYFTLARGACSNTAIRLQIDEMVKQKVDLVIIGATSPNRMEFPKLGKKYNQSDGVYNLDYHIGTYPDRSCQNKNFKHNVVSETFTNILTSDIPFHKKVINDESISARPNITDNQAKALEYYIDYLYDADYKKHMDSFILHSGYKALEDSNIPFVMILYDSQMAVSGFSFENNYRIIKHGDRLNPWTWDKNNTTRRWHTTDQAQEKGAEMWYDYLVEHNFIKG